MDTGCPISFGRGLGGVPGVTTTPPDSMGELTVEWLSEEMRHHIDGVIGAEILKTQTLTIDPVQKLVGICDEPAQSGEGVPIRDLQNVPIVDVNFFGQPIPTIFDTGAWLGYVPRSMTSGLTPVRATQDFYPLYGKFRSDVYEIAIRIGDWETELDFGVLPPVIEHLHQQRGMTTIIGLGLLNTFGIALSLKKAMMTLNCLRS